MRSYPLYRSTLRRYVEWKYIQARHASFRCIDVFVGSRVSGSIKARSRNLGTKAFHAVQYLNAKNLIWK
ncbi:hypothetical protein PUN28_012237 [Cardiocondyla obscurior]|uniref:Ribosomal protein S14 n=1 Tax=Cardiocondyla obscurior TaxID=286306 RepID=A0AAW2FFE2_9HYME